MSGMQHFQPCYNIQYILQSYNSFLSFQKMKHTFQVNCNLKGIYDIMPQLLSAKSVSAYILKLNIKILQ
jgi:hypothetical protein